MCEDDNTKPYYQDTDGDWWRVDRGIVERAESPLTLHVKRNNIDIEDRDFSKGGIYAEDDVSFMIYIYIFTRSTNLGIQI